MKDLEVRLMIKGLTDENREEKYLAAVGQLSKAMGQPVTIRPRIDDKPTEEFAYKAQEELVERMALQFAGMLDDVYHATCEYLGLPVVKTFSKSLFERFLKVRGQQLFNPETGKPLRWGDFYRLVKAIEKFLNMGIEDASKKLILGSASLAKLMSYIEKNAAKASVRGVTLEDVTRGHNFEKLSEDMQVYQKTFGLDDNDMERMALIEKQVGDRFSDLAADAVQKVKDTYYEGVIQKLPKSRISQNLFDRFGDQNRDWRRVVETEHAEIFNNAYLQAEVAKSEPGKKVYFRRREILDGHTCKFCSKIKGTVAVWSDVPLDDEGVQDPHAKVAIWEGKSNMGRKSADYWVPAGPAHPNCRGTWERYYPEDRESTSPEFSSKVNSILERKKKRDALYTEAFREVQAQMKGKKSDSPDFKQALDRVYNEKLKAGGLL